jgi:putative PIN family toxin of toxin-antitoxin system
MRLVLDTNVVASALLRSGPPRQLLQAARERRVELFTSTPLLAELTDVLGRPKFAAKIAASPPDPNLAFPATTPGPMTGCHQGTET